MMRNYGDCGPSWDHKRLIKMRRRTSIIISLSGNNNRSQRMNKNNWRLFQFIFNSPWTLIQSKRMHKPIVEIHKTIYLVLAHQRTWRVGGGSSSPLSSPKCCENFCTIIIIIVIITIIVGPSQLQSHCVINSSSFSFLRGTHSHVCFNSSLGIEKAIVGGCAQRGEWWRGGCHNEKCYRWEQERGKRAL